MRGGAKKRVVILGCTGSIGQQTARIIREFRDDFTVAGLSAHSSEGGLLGLAEEFGCSNYALTSREGPQAIREVLRKSGGDIAVNGISGAAGLLPSVWTLQAGMDLALANKETVVTAGRLIKELADKNKCRILPVDSEHSALFHLTEHFRGEAESLVLTASGGPFRERPAGSFDSITVDEALNHPTWSMGKKITLDSATLANKGLEVIEAAYLFNMDGGHISVVIHPQSIVHALIVTRSGELYAQLSRPDMRHPILDALTYPASVHNGFEKLNLAGCALTFSPPRFKDFPMLPLAYRAVELGPPGCIAYNGANETAAEAFLSGKLLFTQFAEVVSRVMARCARGRADTLEEILALDRAARDEAQKIITQGMTE
ncbi:MAG: 1-deoxy-D-xylulose-5-phosphate reductoisomerase [Spirochaetaceae bacterium]|jgi:1-deoxy-D-xylulose-5-phosphate reductoisomerase|nr:1-deoxy-D-xylulose-5-phosphate reductoisomerase [Spirochaetaceae bacterium]